VGEDSIVLDIECSELCNISTYPKLLDSSVLYAGIQKTSNGLIEDAHATGPADGLWLIRRPSR